MPHDELTPDQIEESANELVNCWNFCGDERAFWKEQRTKHFLLTEADEFKINNRACDLWDAFQSE